VRFLLSMLVAGAWALNYMVAMSDLAFADPWRLPIVIFAATAVWTPRSGIEKFSAELTRWMTGP
jgi:hypothetical protein